MDENPAVGYCDGIKGEELFGWAWYPGAPDQPLLVEILVDGQIAGTTQCNVYRADLRAAGIGHGRYGFRYPLPPLDGRRRASFEVRVQDGPTLKDGVFDYQEEIEESDLPEAFIQKALAPDATPPHPFARTHPRTRFLIYSAGPVDNRAVGAPEYSYGFVAKAFIPLLQRFGEVEQTDGSPEQVERLVRESLARSEVAVLLSFAPPHRTPLGLACPTIPVVAWEYPTIPATAWQGEPRNDWTFVLRQTGRAITLCDASTAAFRSAMGRSYPVVTIPTPVWDRLSNLHEMQAPQADISIAIEGFAFDTRDHLFSALGSIPAAPDRQPDDRQTFPDRLSLDGIVFTSVLAPKDGRKNWRDIIAAFIAANREHADVTLVVKMIGTDPSVWWYELNELMGRQTPYACRVVVLHGFLDDANFLDLIRGTHWVVNASRCEGQCLPLLEFMSAGRPAIAPDHSAMADYITPRNAVIVRASEEYCGFPHDPMNEMTTVRHRIDWDSLRLAFVEAYMIAVDDPERYRNLAAGAREAVRSYCSDDVVADLLDGFLGLRSEWGRRPASPSPLLRLTGS